MKSYNIMELLIHEEKRLSCSFDHTHLSMVGMAISRKDSTFNNGGVFVKTSMNIMYELCFMLIHS